MACFLRWVVCCLLVSLTTTAYPLGLSGGGSGGGGGTGNVNVSGSPTAGQIALWTNPTTIQGSTTLPVTAGGLNVATLPSKGVLVGQGTSPVTAPTPSGNGQCFMSAPTNGTTTDPSFQTCPGTGDILTVANCTTGDCGTAGGTGLQSMSFSVQVAPTPPSVSRAWVYVDSTSKNLAVKDDAGVVKHGVQTCTATTNQWIQSIADDGSCTKTQPDLSNITGNITNAQLPAVISGKEVQRRETQLTDAATVTINPATTDVAYLLTVSQATNFAAPGACSVRRTLALIILSATQQPITFATGTAGSFSAGANLNFPTQTSGSGIEDHLIFVCNPVANRWLLVGSTIPIGSVGVVQLPVISPHLPSTGAALIDRAENNDRLLFDTQAITCAWWQFRLASDYLGNPTIKLDYSMQTATTGVVRFDVSVMAVSPGDSADVNTDSYAAANNCDDAAAPGTVGFMKEISCVLTNNDNLTANDFVKIKICSDTTGAGNATGLIELLASQLEYVR